VNPFLLPPKMIDERGMLPIHPMLEWTAGGFAANPSDLVRWAQALFEGRAIPEDGVAEMTRDPVKTPDGRRYGSGSIATRHRSASRGDTAGISPATGRDCSTSRTPDRRGGPGEPRLSRRSRTR
jgi:CubicO group peptidase (beta-lactamase class C family)